MIDHLKKTVITDDEVSDLISAIEQASKGVMGDLKADKRSKMPDIEKITLEELRSKRRIMEFIYPRMIFAHECREVYSLGAIARFLKIKSHATILNYLKNYDADFMYVKGFRRFSWEVTRLLKGKTKQ